MADKKDQKVKIKKLDNPKAGKVISKVMREQREDADIKTKWWFSDDKELHQGVFSVTNAIVTHQQFHHSTFLKYARLYTNQEIIGFGHQFHERTGNNLRSPITGRVTYNVVRSVIDTASSKIGKSRPRPLVLTSGGDFGLQQKAKKLSKYLEGAFDSAKTYEVGARIFVDACVFGTGVIKVFAEDGKIVTQRVLPHEIIVDHAEGIYGEPRQIHQKRFISRDVLIDMFPDKADAIQAASSGDTIGNQNSHSQDSLAADQILVVESWHLPSGSDSRDGKHAITIKDETLFSEEYEKDHFPFVFFRWSPSLVGFFGTSVTEELVGIQLEINKLLRNIQKAQHLAAVPRVFVESGSQVVASHMTNETGGIVKYVGTPPQIGPSPAMSQEVYVHLETLYNRAFEITGISQLSATSRKPSGLDSGVAIREAQDIESERFALVSQRYEEMYLEMASLIIDISRDLFEEFPNLKINVKGGKFIETIKWSEVDMEDDKFAMKTFPTSLLPTTPAGRLQKTQELLQAGFIDRKQGLALLDFPDLEQVMNLENAALDDINMIMDKITNDGKYIAPEPFMDLELALKISQSTYLRGKSQDLPESKLDLLRRFMEDVVSLKIQGTPPAPAQPIPGNEAQAVPEGAPVSDILPTPGSENL